jgi:two-component system, NarL family, sensor histidine kinase UhpB
MSLRLRLIALVCLLLLTSISGGGALIIWHAAGRVQTELLAALHVGANAVQNALRELNTAGDRATDLRRLVATFDGDRHLRATLLDAAGSPAVTSRLFVPTQTVPGWFARLIGNRVPALQIPAPDATAILLRPDAVNELGEVWAESRDGILVLAGFAALSALLISVVIGRALRSLEDLSAAFGRIGDGDYHPPLPIRGPTELKRLAIGFNHMAQRLATAAAQNRRLNERLLTLQAEERAELARDLHDEVGPLLFAVDMSAATVELLANSGRPDDIPAHIGFIHQAVGQMQRQVRAILQRLRPIGSLGLRTALERLVGFWQERRPDVEFAVRVALEEDRLGDGAKETIYRVVQEGLSNAIRHAGPKRIEVAVTHDEADGVRVILSDDGSGLPADGPLVRGARLGLVGMRERVMAMAGSLSVASGVAGKGLILVASLPCASAVPERDQEVME